MLHHACQIQLAEREAFDFVIVGSNPNDGCFTDFSFWCVPMLLDVPTFCFAFSHIMDTAPSAPQT